MNLGIEEILKKKKYFMYKKIGIKCISIHVYFEYRAY